jgi:hypothetical protein
LVLEVALGDWLKVLAASKLQVLLQDFIKINSMA